MDTALPVHDYVSPGFAVIRPDAAFPDMVVGDTRIPRWRWLRRWVAQNWYTDRRNPEAGFLCRDEALLLYNAALLVRGKSCLEIGCWRGWSTVHLALGSGAVDVIDPIISDADFRESIRQACRAAGVSDAVSLHAGFSPAAVDALAETTGKKWSLIFIDGEHEGDAPRLDAEAAMRHAAETAMVLLHDLASPYVAAGLDALRDAGWRTMVYQTMQIMGVAWRGNIEPPAHIPDSNVFWTLPGHLAGYQVSGWERPTLRGNGKEWWPKMTMEDQRDAAMLRAQAAEDEATSAILRAQAADDEAASAKAYSARLRRKTVGLGVSLRAVWDLSRKVLSFPVLWQAEDAVCTDLAHRLSRRRMLLGLLRRPIDERLRIIRAYTAGGPIAQPVMDGILGPMLRSRALLGLLRRSPRSAEAIVGRWLARSMRDVRVGVFQSLQQSLDCLSEYEPALSPVVASDYDALSGDGEAGVSADPRDDTDGAPLPPPSSAWFSDQISQLLNSTDRHGPWFPPPRVNQTRMDKQRENVILVVHQATRTGAPILGWNIACRLSQQYNIFTVMLDGGPLAEDFLGVSAEVYGPFEFGQRTAAGLQLTLPQLLNRRHFKYAIVNSAECREAIEPFFHRRIPTLYLVHEFGCLYPPGSLRLSFDLATEIVFPAPVVFQSSSAAYPRLAKRTTRILPQGMSLAPGVAEAPLTALPPALASLITARQQGELIVLGAGSVEFRKGLDLFIATAMVVRRDAAGRRIHFLWVGSGYQPDQDTSFSAFLREQIERSDLRNIVTFMKTVPNLEPIYALADIFLLSSRLDPLPNVSIDAAYRGIPIVCFKGASGTSDILLSDPETARGVVDHLDSTAAAHAILALANDPDARERVGAATRRLAKATFDMEKYVATLDRLGTDAAARLAVGMSLIWRVAAPPIPRALPAGRKTGRVGISAGWCQVRRPDGRSRGGSAAMDQQRHDARLGRLRQPKPAVPSPRADGGNLAASSYSRGWRLSGSPCGAFVGTFR